MAKKVRKTPPKRKKKKTTKHNAVFFASVKQMLFWVIILFIGFIGLLFLYNYLYPGWGGLPEKERQEITLPGEQAPPKKSSKTTSKQVHQKKTVKNISFPENAEIPRLRTKKNEQIIVHEGYTVSYNSDYRIANWVAWELTSQEAKSTKVERSNKFVKNPFVTGVSATNEDYTRTGYDRGHLAPAADMKWSEKAMRESFYLSNICPQSPALNRGIWKELEEQSRLWAIENGNLLVVAGPVITNDLKRLGKNRVGVPILFYKVICTISDNKYQGIAFLLENKDHKNTTLKAKAIPIDSVEKVTGIDFFHSLPDDLERKMEASVDLKYWFL